MKPSVLAPFGSVLVGAFLDSVEKVVTINSVLTKINIMLAELINNQK